MRVYLPSTLGAVGQLLDTRHLRTDGRGFAVTEALKAADPQADLEEWEFQAYSDAAAASLGLLVRPDVARRRVVVAADLDEDAISPDPTEDSPSAVRVPSEVGMSTVAAVHVDAPAAAAAVRQVLGGASDDLLDDVALEWYLPDELAGLLGEA